MRIKNPTQTQWGLKYIDMLTEWKMWFVCAFARTCACTHTHTVDHLNRNFRALDES